MNSMQSQLQSALPQQLAAIQAQARKAAFERAAVRGEQLMLEATQATGKGNPGAALAAVRKDRYACAAYLAKVNRMPVSARQKRQRCGFSELELMEQLWQEKAAEQRRQQEAAAAETKAKQAKVKAEVQHLRKLAARNGTKPTEAAREPAAVA